MLEDSRDRTVVQDTSRDSVRKSWSKLFRSFFVNPFKVQGRLSGLGESRIPGRLDEEVSEDLPVSDIEINNEKNIEIMEKIEKTREEALAESHFEWVKTERQGDVCRFQTFLFENDTEYVLFTDGTRIRTDLIGDVVLAHRYPEEILGFDAELSNAPYVDPILSQQPQITQYATRVVETDPVVAILEKTKKKTEKITLTLNLKIPAPDLYNVIKENFDNTDEILLNSVMDQIHDNLLRDALKKELQTIYQKRKKSNGTI
jgi:hypothetical protein